MPESLNHRKKTSHTSALTRARNDESCWWLVCSFHSPLCSCCFSHFLPGYNSFNNSISLDFKMTECPLEKVVGEFIQRGYWFLLMFIKQNDKICFAMLNCIKQTIILDTNQLRWRLARALLSGRQKWLIKKINEPDAAKVEDKERVREPVRHQKNNIFF